MKIIKFAFQNGKAKKPYKGRFMFYLVDDETACKLCASDNKAS